MPLPSTFDPRGGVWVDYQDATPLNVPPVLHTAGRTIRLSVLDWTRLPMRLRMVSSSQRTSQGNLYERVLTGSTAGMDAAQSQAIHALLVCPRVLVRCTDWQGQRVIAACERYAATPQTVHDVGLLPSDGNTIQFTLKAVSRLPLLYA
jgi:hypothetical protein